MTGKILLVDDDENLIKLLHISLKKADYIVITSSNAEKAITIAEEERPDLIISDVNMPEMDGLEFCSIIRQKSKVPMVPFIFLSNLKDPESIIHGFRAGADEFLHKPIDRKDLLNNVKKLIERGNRLKRMDSKGEENVVLSGNTSEFTIIEIAQLMNINKRTGVLKVNSAEIYFKSGDIITATFKEFKNEKAVNEIIKLDDAEFSFSSQEIDKDREIKANTMFLLMEACRINDEKKSEE